MARKLSELFPQALENCPAADGIILNAEIDMNAGKVVFTVDYGGSAEPRAVLAAQRGIRDALGACEVVIKPAERGGEFSRELLFELFDSLSKEYPFILTFLRGSQRSYSDGVFTITLRSGGRELIEDSEFIGRFVREAGMFGLSPKICFEGKEYVDGEGGNTVPEGLCEPAAPPEAVSAPAAPSEGSVKEREARDAAPAARERSDELVKKPSQRKKVVMTGRTIDDPVTDISRFYAPGSRASYTVEGTVFSAESRDISNGASKLLTFKVFDDTCALSCKMFLKGKKEELAGEVKDGLYLRLRGRKEYDSYSHCDILVPSDINYADKAVLTDTAEEKRVELHAHTTMSTLDAVIPPAQLVRTAYEWGHRAVAITDHGVVQAFPEAMHELDAIKKADKDTSFKVIYGIEAYLVNDKGTAVKGVTDASFEDETVVFDLETTGFSREQDRITEIGAVIYKNGVTERVFNMLVDPGIHIPERVTELTGITDEMVRGAPGEREALEKFREFAGDRLLMAHNAEFDIGFLRAAAKRCGAEMGNCYLDTLQLARLIYPSLKSYKLNSIVNYLKIGPYHQHRASDDAVILAQVFDKMADQLRGRGCRKYCDIDEVLSSKKAESLPASHCVILVKDLTGLKNLYKMVSASHLEHFHYNPRIPRSMLEENREGLIIGSACEAGELYRAVSEGKDFDELRRIARFYDYLEIQPLCNNEFLVKDGSVRSEEDLKENNRTILRLGKSLNKPVCATCDVHFLRPSDAIIREIILTAKSMKGAHERTPLFFRTTSEMLKEFSYLSEEEAREVVISNPNLICDMIGEVRPIPDGSFPPSLEGSEEQLEEIVYRRAKEIYGDPIPEIVEKRIKKEITPVINNGYAVLYLIAQKLVANSVKHGYIVGSRGSVGSTILGALTGISEVNPLPPHYLCKKCKHSEFVLDGSYQVGFDMPPKDCPVCGAPMDRDGVDIPFETFLGFSGEKAPDIDLNFSSEFQPFSHKYTEEVYGRNNCYRAGTISTIQTQTAFGYVKKYCEERGVSFPPAYIDYLSDRCSGIKRSTGQHPGGIVLVPRGYDINDFTPVQHPADRHESEIVTTHFDFSSMHDTILKLDELGHDIPTIFKYLKDLTGIDFFDVPLMDEKVMSLFTSTEALGVTPEQIGSLTGTFALPEMGTELVRNMLIETKPKTFADLLQVSGLSHGRGVWLGNAQELIHSGEQTISSVIALRDNIMLYLIRKGIEPKLAFKITEYVRKKPVRKLTPEFEKAMREHGVPEWYMNSCNKIEYMFPKAHAAAYVISALRLGWFKVYKPLEFYSAYFTVRGKNLEYETVVGGPDAVRRRQAEIKALGNKASQKEGEVGDMLQIAGEMFARGYKFLPADMFVSDKRIFLIENGAIRLPISSIPGVGPSGAENIDAAREKKFYSIEEFAMISGVSSDVIEKMKQFGVFGSLPESEQLSFF